MASLGWVTPGAATEGVTPLFFPKKPGDLYLLIAVTITIAFYCFHSGVTPPGCHPHLFLPVRPRLSTILCKFAHKFFFLRVLPPGGCHPGRSTPPPSDATAFTGWKHLVRNSGVTSVIRFLWAKGLCSNTIHSDIRPSVLRDQQYMFGVRSLLVDDKALLTVASLGEGADRPRWHPPGGDTRLNFLWLNLVFFP